jgi:hypothetical protein
MNWEALGAIGETIGAIAVILTLGYLAVQIRQNTRMLEASVLSATTNAHVAFNHLLGSDAAAARVFQVGLENFPSLSENEQRQFLNLLRAAFISYEHAFFSYRKGLLDAEVWSRYLRGLKDMLQLSHVSVWWKARKGAYTESFVSAIEQAPPSAAPPLADSVIRSMLDALGSPDEPAAAR